MCWHTKKIQICLSAPWQQRKQNHKIKNYNLYSNKTWYSTLAFILMCYPIRHAILRQFVKTTKKDQLQQKLTCERSGSRLHCLIPGYSHIHSKCSNLTFGKSNIFDGSDCILHSCQSICLHLLSWNPSRKVLTPLCESPSYSCGSSHCGIVWAHTSLLPGCVGLCVAVGHQNAKDRHLQEVRRWRMHICTPLTESCWITMML